MQLLIRKTFICVLFALSFSGHTQNETKRGILFIRVFDAHNNKIAKGLLMYANDTLLVLSRSKKVYKINPEYIDFIKTRRSRGSNVLAASLVGAGLGVIYGVTSAQPEKTFGGYSEGEGAIYFGAMGALGGAAIGGIISVTKNPKIYIVNGKLENWKKIKDVFKNYRLIGP